MQKKLILSSLLGLLLLAACADSDSKSEPEPEVVNKGPVPICPQVAIIRDLEKFSDYGAEAPDPSQLVSQARMNSIEGDCSYPKTGGVDIRFSINFIAARGPRLGGLHTSVPYFIALIDPDDKIVTKTRMTKEFGFSSKEKTTEDSEDLHVFIPLAKDKIDSGPHYRILVGFQFNEEQWKSMRGHAGETTTP